jgi:hypothetical protein
MDAAKKVLYEMIEEIPEKDIAEVIDFVQYFKLKREKEMFKDLQKTS